MKISMISDVHEQWQNLVIPECDLLISAGDYSYRGQPQVVEEFHIWLSKQPAKHIISCQGNHEVWVEKYFNEAKERVEKIDKRIIFTAFGDYEIEGLKIHCDATTPRFHDWAWNVDRGEKIKRQWAAIPDNTNILVTHGPAYGILDRSLGRIARDTDEPLGCKDLLNRISQLQKLKLHVFGHIHGSSGMKKYYFPYGMDGWLGEIIELENGINFVNAAICDEYYKPTNPVRFIEL